MQCLCAYHACDKTVDDFDAVFHAHEEFVYCSRQHTQLHMFARWRGQEKLVRRCDLPDVTDFLCDTQHVAITYQHRLALHRKQGPVTLKQDRERRRIAACSLVSSCDAQRFKTATLYLAIELMDRYYMMTKDENPEDPMFLCFYFLVLASKFEEIYPLEIDDNIFGFVPMQERAKQELGILRTLEYTVYYVTPFDFLVRNLRMLGADVSMAYAARYLLERAVVYGEHFGHPIHVVASAAALVAFAYTRVNAGCNAHDIQKQWKHAVLDQHDIVPPMVVIKPLALRMARMEARDDKLHVKYGSYRFQRMGLEKYAKTVPYIEGF